MEDVATSDTAVSGRPTEFDRESVLNALVGLFWEKGYDGTSMADITKATGLSKSSIYNSFGSKHELLGMAMSRYQDMMSAQINCRLIDGTEGLGDIHWFVDFQREKLLSADGRQGCLMVNTSAELGFRDPDVVEESLKYRMRMKGMFRPAFIRAAELGEIDADLVEHYTRLLLATTMASLLMGRSGTEEQELSDFLDTIHTLVESFRI